jgi:shikimate kinase
MTGPPTDGPPTDGPAMAGPAMATRPVVVVGLMGAGKTSVATRIAAALGRPLHDSDADLQEWYGRSAAQHVHPDGAGPHEHGIAMLHRREARQLRVALSQQPPPVIAAAASVVDDPSCRRALADAFVVWLDAPPAVLADRMRDGEHRPHFDADLEKMLTGQRERRAGWFGDVADAVIDVAEAGPDQAAAAALAALAASGRSSGG